MTWCDKVVPLGTPGSSLALHPQPGWSLAFPGEVIPGTPGSSLAAGRKRLKQPRS